MYKLTVRTGRNRELGYVHLGINGFGTYIRVCSSSPFPILRHLPSHRLFPDLRLPSHRLFLGSQFAKSPFVPWFAVCQVTVCSLVRRLPSHRLFLGSPFAKSPFVPLVRRLPSHRLLPGSPFAKSPFVPWFSVPKLPFVSLFIVSK